MRPSIYNKNRLLGRRTVQFGKRGRYVNAQVFFISSKVSGVLSDVEQGLSSDAFLDKFSMVLPWYYCQKLITPVGVIRK